MQLKKISLGVVAVLLLCYGYIWCNYDFFYEEYDPEKVAPQFEAKNMRAPIYDTLVVNHLKIGYLSNRRYNYVEDYDYLGGVRNPCLVLFPANGDNITRFLPYFLDEELNSKFHIIAIDRIGFGGSKVEENSEGEPFGYYDSRERFEENALYAMSTAPDRILKNEIHYLDEVRMIFGGSTAVIGLGAAYEMYLSSQKALLLHANLAPRWALSRGYSSWVVSGIGQLIFPSNYVSKHQDLRLADQVVNKHMTHWLARVKYVEDEENNKEYSMYKGASQAGKGKILFFRGLSQSAKEKVKELTDEKTWESNDHPVDIYNAKEVLKVLKDADAYTLDFNRL